MSVNAPRRTGRACPRRRLVDPHDFDVEDQQRIRGDGGRGRHRVGEVGRDEHAPLRPTVHHRKGLAPTRDYIVGADHGRLAAAVAAVEFLAVEEPPAILHRDVVAGGGQR